MRLRRNGCNVVAAELGVRQQPIQTAEDRCQLVSECYLRRSRSYSSSFPRLPSMATSRNEPTFGGHRDLSWSRSPKPQIGSRFTFVVSLSKLCSERDSCASSMKPPGASLPRVTLHSGSIIGTESAPNVFRLSLGMRQFAVLHWCSFSC